MKLPFHSLLLGLSLTVSLFSVQGQSFSPSRYAGFGIGSSLVGENLPEGYMYTPLSMLGEASLWEKGRFTIYGELQFTSVLNPELKGEFEFGSNFGIQYRLPLRPHLWMTASVGSGPHYVTLETSRQANGFLFSDNFELGFHYHIPSVGVRVNLRGRFRHISNAGLKSPNGGIDNLFLVAGFTRHFRLEK